MRLIIDIEDDYEPGDGDAFNAVMDALGYFEIPAMVRQTTSHHPKCRPNNGGTTTRGKNDTQKHGR